MSEMPKFQFKSSITEDEVKKSEEELTKKDPKGFKPGTYDLKIISAEYDKPLAGDETWHGYKVTLGVDTRSIKTYISVPTKSPAYNKPGMDPKYRMLMFHKFRDFLRGLGEDESVEALNKTLNKLFADPSALVGKTLKVDVGYKGIHTEFVAKNEFKLVDRTGKELVPETFADRDSAKAFAAEQGKIVQDFPEIVKIHRKEKQQELVETNPWGE